MVILYCIFHFWTYAVCDFCKVLHFSNRSNNHLDDEILLARVV